MELFLGTGTLERIACCPPPKGSKKRKPPEVPKKRERQAGSVDCSRRRTCSRDHGGIPLHQIGEWSRQPVGLVLRETVKDRDVVPIDETGASESA
jgi:hypothetical protein